MKNENNFSPFYNSFCELCEKNNLTPSSAAKMAGISSGSPTAWKSGAIPKPAQRKKLCDLFGVEESVLLGYEEGAKKEAHPEQGGLRPTDQALLDAFKSADLVTQELIRRALGL